MSADTVITALKTIRHDVLDVYSELYSSNTKASVCAIISSMCYYLERDNKSGFLEYLSWMRETSPSSTDIVVNLLMDQLGCDIKEELEDRIAA